jgi:hypothetical protein
MLTTVRIDWETDCSAEDYAYTPANGAAMLHSAAQVIVAQLEEATPASDWPGAADRELLTVADLLTAAGLNLATVLPPAVVQWLADVGAL